MSEQAQEQPAEPTPAGDQAPAKADVFPVGIVLRETGRTHTVTGAGVQPIADEAGNLEREYALVATIDGVEITLATYNYGRTQTLVAAGQRTQDSAQQ